MTRLLLGSGAGSLQLPSLSYLYLLLPQIILLLINSSHSSPINRQAGISENVYITFQNDTSGVEQRVCSIDSMTYEDGESIPTSSPCEHCICRPPGFACTIISCEYRPGCKAIKRSNQCCPEYQCECEKDGKIYQNGEKILDDNNPCEVCYCQGGDVICAVIDCYWRSDCQPRYIENRCCPLYDHCPPPSDLGPIRPTHRPTTTTTQSTAISWFNASAPQSIYATGPTTKRPLILSTTTTAIPAVVSEPAEDKVTELKVPSPELQPPVQENIVPVSQEVPEVVEEESSSSPAIVEIPASVLEEVPQHISQEAPSHVVVPEEPVQHVTPDSAADVHQEQYDSHVPAQPISDEILAPVPEVIPEAVPTSPAQEHIEHVTPDSVSQEQQAPTISEEAPVLLVESVPELVPVPVADPVKASSTEEPTQHVTLDLVAHTNHDISTTPAAAETIVPVPVSVSKESPAHEPETVIVQDPVPVEVVEVQQENEQSDSIPTVLPMEAVVSEQHPVPEQSLTIPETPIAQEVIPEQSPIIPELLKVAGQSLIISGPASDQSLNALETPSEEVPVQLEAVSEQSPAVPNTVHQQLPTDPESNDEQITTVAAAITAQPPVAQEQTPAVQEDAPEQSHILSEPVSSVSPEIVTELTPVSVEAAPDSASEAPEASHILPESSPTIISDKIPEQSAIPAENPADQVPLIQEDAPEQGPIVPETLPGQPSIVPEVVQDQSPIPAEQAPVIPESQIVPEPEVVQEQSPIVPDTVPEEAPVLPETILGQPLTVSEISEKVSVQEESAPGTSEPELPKPVIQEVSIIVTEAPAVANPQEAPAYQTFDLPTGLEEVPVSLPEDLSDPISPEVPVSIPEEATESAVGITAIPPASNDEILEHQDDPVIPADLVIPEVPEETTTAKVEPMHQEGIISELHDASIVIADDPSQAVETEPVTPEQDDPSVPVPGAALVSLSQDGVINPTEEIILEPVVPSQKIPVLDQKIETQTPEVVPLIVDEPLPITSELPTPQEIIKPEVPEQQKTEAIVPATVETKPEVEVPASVNQEIVVVQDEAGEPTTPSPVVQESLDAASFTAAEIITVTPTKPLSTYATVLPTVTISASDSAAHSSEDEGDNQILPSTTIISSQPSLVVTGEIPMESVHEEMSNGQVEATTPVLLAETTESHQNDAPPEPAILVSEISTSSAEVSTASVEEISTSKSVVEEVPEILSDSAVEIETEQTTPSIPVEGIKDELAQAPVQTASEPLVLEDEVPSATTEKAVYSEIQSDEYIQETTPEPEKLPVIEPSEIIVPDSLVPFETEATTLKVQAVAAVTEAVPKETEEPAVMDGIPKPSQHLEPPINDFAENTVPVDSPAEPIQEIIVAPPKSDPVEPVIMSQIKHIETTSKPTVTENVIGTESEDQSASFSSDETVSDNISDDKIPVVIVDLESGHTEKSTNFDSFISNDQKIQPDETVETTTHRLVQSPAEPLSDQPLFDSIVVSVAQDEKVPTISEPEATTQPALEVPEPIVESEPLSDELLALNDAQPDPVPIETTTIRAQSSSVGSAQEPEYLHDDFGVTEVPTEAPLIVSSSTEKEPVIHEQPAVLSDPVHVEEVDLAPVFDEKPGNDLGVVPETTISPTQVQDEPVQNDEPGAEFLSSDDTTEPTTESLVPIPVQAEDETTTSRPIPIRPQVQQDEPEQGPIPNDHEYHPSALAASASVTAQPNTTTSKPEQEEQSTEDEELVRDEPVTTPVPLQDEVPATGPPSADSQFRLDLSIFEDEPLVSQTLKSVSAKKSEEISPTTSPTLQQHSENEVVFDEAPAVTEVVPQKELSDAVEVPTTPRNLERLIIIDHAEEGTTESGGQLLDEPATTEPIVPAHYAHDGLQVNEPVLAEVRRPPPPLPRVSPKFSIPAELVKKVEPISDDLDDFGRSDASVRGEADNEVANTDETWFWRTVDRIRTLGGLFPPAHPASSRKPRSTKEKGAEGPAYVYVRGKKVLLKSPSLAGTKKAKYTAFPRFLLW